jgi:hypothetical protein
MRNLLKFTLLIFILSLKTYSQNSSDSIKKNWKYFKLKSNTQAFIVDHLPSPALCGPLAFASVTIVKTEDGETFRVLDLCNSKTYTTHQKIKIIPGIKPKFNVIFLSQSVIKQNADNKLEPEYDYKILKTTWATIEQYKSNKNVRTNT